MPPQNVTSYSPSPEILSIAWDYHKTVDGFVVMYREYYQTADPYVLYGADGMNVTFTWLKPGTWYAYRVVPFEKARGNGVATELFKVKTVEKRAFITFFYNFSFYC